MGTSRRSIVRNDACILHRVLILIYCSLSSHRNAGKDGGAKTMRLLVVSGPPTCRITGTGDVATRCSRTEAARRRAGVLTARLGRSVRVRTHGIAVWHSAFPGNERGRPLNTSGDDEPTVFRTQWDCLWKDDSDGFDNRSVRTVSRRYPVPTARSPRRSQARDGAWAHCPGDCWTPGSVR